MNKPYLLCAFDHVFEANRYFWSLRSSFGDTVQPIVITYTLNGVEGEAEIPPGTIYAPMKKEYPGNTGRHRDVHRVLKGLIEQDPDAIDKDAWFIWTDVHDVIFQCPFPEFPTDADILVCDEGRTFGEIEFWRGQFPQDTWNWRAYNAGCFAMRYEALMAFWENLETEWQSFFEWYVNGSLPKISDVSTFPYTAPSLKRKIRMAVAQIFNGYQDTLSFNTFLQKTKYRVKTVPGLFTCYAFDYYDGNVVIGEDGKTYTKDGQMVSVVHFNGDTKKFIPIP